MIPLQLLLPIPFAGGWGLGTMVTCPICGLPVGILVAGFKDKEELLEIADYLYKQVISIYENWDKVIEEEPQTDIPDVFKEAFPDEQRE